MLSYVKVIQVIVMMCWTILSQPSLSQPSNFLAYDVTAYGQFS